jgi:hypothetical protein
VPSHRTWPYRWVVVAISGPPHTSSSERIRAPPSGGQPLTITAQAPNR